MVGPGAAGYGVPEGTGHRVRGSSPMSVREIAAQTRQRWAGLQEQPWWPRVAPLLVALTLVAVGVLGAAALLDSVWEQDDAARLDGPLSSWLIEHRSPALTTALTAVSATFTIPILPVIVLLVAAVLCWRARSLWRGGLLLAAMLGATALSEVSKRLVGRSRPPLTGMVDPPLTSYAFPSGHTLAAAVFMLVLGYLIRVDRRSPLWLIGWLLLTALVVGMVALSRMYLGYHWPTDVAASAFLSLAVLGGVIAVDGEYRVRRAADVTRPGEDRGQRP